MGKEWLSWGGSNRSRKRSKSSSETTTTTNVTTGCMSNVLQIFDLHNYFPFPLNNNTNNTHSSFQPQSFLPQDPPNILLKGVEAPRNSLELDEHFNGAKPLSPPIINKDEILSIPMGIQIKTSVDARSSRTEEFSSEFSSSPGTKTPNLVARLMGLDLLPETSSPSSSSSSSSKTRLHPQIQNLKEDIRSRKSRSATHGDFPGTRSLPETPRISAARRSDVDNHRYSLQSNKENCEEIEFSSYLTAKMTRRIVQEDENRSPGHYARQIVKQVKESISRRVGTDITNNVRNREQRRDQELVVLLKSKKLSNRSVIHVEESCSPRIKSQLLELKENKPVNSSLSSSTSVSKINTLHSPKLSPSPLSSTSTTVDDKPKIQKSSINGKCSKNVGSDKYNSRLKKLPPQSSGTIRNKPDEPFVRSPTKNKAIQSEKKCKRTPLSTNFLHINVPTTKLSQIQGEKQSQVNDTSQSSKRSSQLSRNQSHSYKLETTSNSHVVVHNTFITAASTTTSGGAELEYISTILKRTGIDSNTPVSFTNWYSPSHPLDPSIFHHLETSLPDTAAAATSALDHRTNRKLIFDLVDELLVEILKPYMNLKPWTPSVARDREMNGSQLTRRLCCRIRGFPSADCRVLEDIDGLIEEDLGRRIKEVEVEEESEGMVTEIEREIMETMVHETAMVVWGWSGNGGGNMITWGLGS